METLAKIICKHKKLIIFISIILLVLSVIGMKLTKINYDILVYLPEDIETIKGQNMLTDDFNMGSYSIAVVDNIKPKDILKIEDKIRKVDGVEKVISIYDAIGVNIPIDMLPSDITKRLNNDNSNVLFITFSNSTSSYETITAVNEIRKIGNINQGGMSSMVLDTMNLSNKEIFIYIVIAVLLCIIVLELSLDSYIVPILLLLNIGFAILFNLGTNIFLGEISYITKALVAVLQLGVTTDFSIFLYHSYQDSKKKLKDNEKAMICAIKETFSSVIGSSLTTIVGFLVLCMMKLTLGKDLGIVMAKGVLLGVITVLTLFPSMLLIFDKLIEKTKHKSIIPKFDKISNFIVNNNKVIFAIFIILLIPTYLAYSKTEVYYKLDKSLPDTLESIKTNKVLKDKFNIASLEILLVDKNIKNNDIDNMTQEISDISGIDFVLSPSKIRDLGITNNMLDKNITNIFENDKYQMILINSVYDVATDELNSQTKSINKIIKKYDKNAILAGEGPLMKDLIEISDTDFKNVNISSILAVFIVLLIVLKAIGLPALLILTIEFAIFLNMSISYFSGVTLPFIAPIVLGTVQLGATIDYAILLTTTYKENRKSIKDKKKAMKKSLDKNAISIFVSAMCFFAATFAVGIYSKIEMIGSLCSLISRGAIISMLVVIFILPSVILTFDKLIIKERKNDMKNKKIIASIFLLMLIIPINIFALTKDETVFSKLNSDGTFKKTIINETIINDSSDDKILDYTMLNDIINLNGDEKFERINNDLTWENKKKDIFYQGTIIKDLPVTVNVTYYLNNEEKKLDDILGKKGNITISLKYNNNTENNVLVNGRYQNLKTPFVIALTTILDSKNNYNITVTNGKVIRLGNNNVLASIASPGMYDNLKLDSLKSLDKVVINFDTDSFKMPTIYSAVTSKLLDDNDLKVFDKLDGLYNSFGSLKDGIDKINDGANSLSDGTTTLKSKLKESLENLKNNNSNALTDEDINMIKEKTVSSVENSLTEEYLNQISEQTWNEVKENLNPNDEKAMEIVSNSVTKAVMDYLNKHDLYNDYVTCNTALVYLEKGISMSEEQQLSCYKINNSSVNDIKEAAITSTSSAVSEISSYVAENVSKQVSINILKMASIKTAENLSVSLSNEVANTVKNESLKQISESLSELYNGVELIDNGVSDLKNGISLYNVDGITKLNNLINNDAKGFTEKVSKLIDLSNDYDSYAGKLPSYDGSTKFILTIDSKSKKENKKIAIKEKSKDNLIARIKNLFK